MSGIIRTFCFRLMCEYHTYAFETRGGGIAFVGNAILLAEAIPIRARKLLRVSDDIDSRAIET